MKKISLLLGSMLLVGLVWSQDVKRIKIADLEKTIAESKTPLVVNFWATFCLPCIEEIPYFLKEVKAHAKDSVQILLVSLDMEDDYAKIKPFAAKQSFTAPIVWLNETDANYFCPKIDPKWSGVVPSTLFINNKKGYRKFFENKLSEEQFVRELAASL